MFTKEECSVNQTDVFGFHFDARAKTGLGKKVSERNSSKVKMQHLDLIMQCYIISRQREYISLNLILNNQNDQTKHF